VLPEIFVSLMQAVKGMERKEIAAQWAGKGKGCGSRYFRNHTAWKEKEVFDFLDEGDQGRNRKKILETREKDRP